jgi:hypothetical protein
MTTFSKYFLLSVFDILTFVKLAHLIVSVIFLILNITFIISSLKLYINKLMRDLIIQRVSFLEVKV